MAAICHSQALFAQCDDPTPVFQHNYKYFDDDLTIRIESDTFNAFVARHEFYEDRIRGYKDSLGVVLMGEFDDWRKTNIFTHRLSYSWLRLGYHLWLSAEEAEAMGAEYGYDHPYAFRWYITHCDEHDARMEAFLAALRTKVYAESQDARALEGSVESMLGAGQQPDAHPRL